MAHRTRRDMQFARSARKTAHPSDLYERAQLLQGRPLLNHGHEFSKEFSLLNVPNAAQSQDMTKIFSDTLEKSSAAPRAAGMSRQSAKTWVALSGALLSAWVLLHMVGTLSVFGGKEAMNGYARALRDVPGLLVVMRVTLLLLFVTHVFLTVRLALHARAARPVRYACSTSTSRSWLSRSMKFTGPMIGVWLVVHVLQMYGMLGAAYAPGDVYTNLLRVLDSQLMNLVYIVAAVLFGQHLWHGLSSVQQTVGLHRRLQSLLGPTCLVFTLVVVAGFVAPSLAVFWGLLDLAP